MKKMFLCLTLLVFSASLAIATGWGGPHSYVSDSASLENASPVMSFQRYGEDYTDNQGRVFYNADVFASGDRSARVNAEGSGSTSFRSFAGQREINGGELSVAFSKSNGHVNVSGLAVGRDYGYFNGYDYASVDIGVEGTLLQSNGVYSDDGGHAEAWANQGSMLNFDASIHNQNFGMCSRKASVYNELDASGTTFGGSAAYAKQTANKSFVKSITANTGNARLNGAFDYPNRLDVSVSGSGVAGGHASLPYMGNADYNASFQYTGGNNTFGLAKGTATVQQTGQYSVQSSVSASSKVGQFNGGNSRYNGPEPE